MSRVVTIIPARGGSKSLPKKNILLLNDKPLVAYSIEYSLTCEKIERTIVSTDSEEISQIAKEFGADVPFIRPSEFAQDDTRDYPFMRHALDFLDSIGEVYDIYVLLRPTSPTRPKNLIERAVQILDENITASSVRSVAKIKEHPYRAWTIEDNGGMKGFVNNIEESYNIPRQELPDVYFQTGDIEAIRRDTLLKGSVSGDNVYPLVIDYDEMVDIDHLSDLKKAEERLK